MKKILIENYEFENVFLVYKPKKVQESNAIILLIVLIVSIEYENSSSNLYDINLNKVIYERRVNNNLINNVLDNVTPRIGAE